MKEKILKINGARTLSEDGVHETVYGGNNEVIVIKPLDPSQIVKSGGNKSYPVMFFLDSETVEDKLDKIEYWLTTLGEKETAGKLRNIRDTAAGVDRELTHYREIYENGGEIGSEMSDSAIAINALAHAKGESAEGYVYSSEVDWEREKELFDRE